MTMIQEWPAIYRCRATEVAEGTDGASAYGTDISVVIALGCWRIAIDRQLIILM